MTSERALILISSSCCMLSRKLGSLLQQELPHEHYKAFRYAFCQPAALVVRYNAAR